MEAFWIELVNMSYQAAIVVCFILAARWLASLIKVPKKYCCMLWAIPFIRMLFPIHIESVLSLLPKKDSFLPENIAYMDSPRVNTGSSAVDIMVSQSLPQPAVGASANPMQIVLALLQGIWLLGVIGLVIYSVFSCLRLFGRLRCGVHFKDNIWLADHIESPFVLGVFRPRIYVPSDTTKEEGLYAIAHEQMHIRRKDHLVKIAAFGITVVHWFNPFAWVAYVLLCRDMEMACDEAVLRQYGEECKGEYAGLLLNYATGRRINGVPLALSEGNPGKRIHHIMHYKKPLFWVSAAAVLALILLAVSLLSNPVTKEKNGVAEGYYELVSDKEMVGAGITIDGEWMSFSYSMISSHFAYGTYTIEDDILTLTEQSPLDQMQLDGSNQYRFRIDGDCLIFVEEGSSPVLGSGIPEIDSVVDDSVFRWQCSVEELEKRGEENAADNDEGADGGTEKNVKHT